MLGLLKWNLWKLLPVLMLFISGPALSQARGQTAHSDPVEFSRIEFSVGSGPLRTIEEAQEYCAAVGMKLPSPALAETIYHQTLNSKGQSKLKNYDNNETPGSFWTSFNYRSRKSFLFAKARNCPVQFEIRPPALNKQDLMIKTWRLRPFCQINPKPRALTVCVPDTPSGLDSTQSNTSEMSRL
jgi:hypothetical protein